MKKIRFASMLAAAALSVAATSCVDNDGVSLNSTETRSFTDCFNTVYDSTDGNVALDDHAQYRFEFKNYSDGTVKVKVTIADLRIDDEMQYSTVILPEFSLDLKQDGSYAVSATDVVPENLSESAGVSFTQFNMSMITLLESSTVIAGQANVRTVYSISYVVNNRFHVTAYPSTCYLYGTTKSVGATDGNAFETKSTRYAVTFNTKKLTARIDITGAQFAQHMPSMNMTFPDVPFTAGVSTISLAAESVTPMIANVPYPDFPISDLEGTVNPAIASSALGFSCTPPRMGLYNVTVALSPIPAN